MIDFKRTSPIGPPAAMRISRDQMIEQFKQAGYRLISEHDFLPYQYFLEFAPAPGPV